MSPEREGERKRDRATGRAPDMESHGLRNVARERRGEKERQSDRERARYGEPWRKTEKNERKRNTKRERERAPSSPCHKFLLFRVILHRCGSR